ncbi:MAG: GAF domain-containing sensor histidine kinase [Chloroflexota bacterium]|nr:GAF domain-containing sensor histidine kinase [Chloroflexota bacterium]
MHSATAASPTVGSFIGVPIMLNDGQFFGTLCAVDPEPQELSDQQAHLLIVLGRIIATQIERDHELDARRQAEAEQARLYRAAQDAIREREALLSIASHELKNPLAGLLGYAHLLQRRATCEINLPERDQRALQAIVTQAERLNGMLTDLLDISRLDSGQFAVEQLPLDLSTLVHAVVAEVEPTLVRHTVTVQDADNPIMVLGDQERLAQVLRNLLGNAIKYSPAGGQITIQLAAEHKLACLSIQDQGIGIPEEALPNLFQRFYRAPNATGLTINGFGIGLYVVKEIVTRHGGTITVTTTEGQGTTFTMCVPLLASVD